VRWLAAAALLVLLLLPAVLSSYAITVFIFIFFYAFGFTINTMTLMALALSIGMLIDDAIVVLENVYRHMEKGVPAERAASEATDEVGLAVLATTFAVCAVFVPNAFLSGVVGRFFREFGIVASCAVCMSTLVALTLVVGVEVPPDRHRRHPAQPPAIAGRTTSVSRSRTGVARSWR